jgi:leader peptidase (prepilin peptidase)/N-methyltransferase
LLVVQAGDYASFKFQPPSRHNQSKEIPGVNSDPPTWLVVLIAPFVGALLAAVVTHFISDESRHPEPDSARKRAGFTRTASWMPIVGWLQTRDGASPRSARINRHRLATELGAVAVAIWAAAEVSGWMLVVSCLLGWVLLALATIDIDRLILPDPLTLPLVAGGLAVSYAVDRNIVIDHIIGAGLGFVVFVAVRYAYAALRSREGLGLGDAKLLAAIGAWVTWHGLPTAVLIAAGFGLVVTVAFLAMGRRRDVPSRLPFGPFLAAGGWLVWLYGPLTFA